jgi:hypothetical protein
MSHRVNAEGLRLGASRFWKSELFSSFISNFTQKFLAVYLLLKKKLDSFFFKIVFFKIIFLKCQKILILVNTYKIINIFQDFKKQLTAPKLPFSRKKVLSQPILKIHRYTKNKSIFKVFLAKKKYLVKIPGRVLRDWDSGLRPRKGMFSVSRVGFVSFNFMLERFLLKALLFPVELRLKNVFSLKKKYTGIKKSPLTLLNLCRAVYKKTRNFWRLKKFLYLRDAINILSLAFFYHKSDLLSDYLADIVQLRRKFLLELKHIKILLPHFKNYYFLIYGASLKINVLGKIFGQRKRRFRCFSIQEGLKFSTQDIAVNISYSLAQTWNIFGSFGVKVWIYKSIVKSVVNL